MNAGVQVVIPARGGSTRIPGKNLRTFNGAPMIQWPIRAALEAAGVDAVMVSTDSEEIARVGSDCGAEVPFTRPTELANDTAGTAPVILHALAEQGRVFVVLGREGARHAADDGEALEARARALVEQGPAAHAQHVRIHPAPGMSSGVGGVVDTHVATRA